MKEIILNVLNELETKKTLNIAQKEMLINKYNYHSGGWDYKIDDFNSLIIECNDDTFRNLEHFLGLEYEKEDIEVLIKVGRKVIVSYSGGGRIDELISQLESLETVLTDSEKLEYLELQ